jgi:hypothetical protein
VSDEILKPFSLTRVASFFFFFQKTNLIVSIKLKTSNSSSCKTTANLLEQDIRHNMFCMKTSFHMSLGSDMFRILKKLNLFIAVHLVVFTCKLYEASKQVSDQPGVYVETATSRRGL